MVSIRRGTVLTLQFVWTKSDLLNPSFLVTNLRKEHLLKIYVGNLSSDIDDARLNDLVTPFGKPTSSSVAKDRSSGQSKGFGFVEFGNAEEAKAAIAGLNGKEVGGKVLKASEAKSQTPDKGRY